VALDPDQRSRLLAAKLRVLVDDRWGPDPARRPGAFPGGATLEGAAADGGAVAWVLVDEGAARSLGAVLAWAHRARVHETNLLAEAAAGLLARRAGQFVDAPPVWRVDGRSLVEAAAEPVSAPIEPAAAALDLVGLLRDAGVEIVIEQGEVRGELRGLEVARIVVDGAGEARIEVGVGRHDREAFALLHGDLPPADALAAVVERVRLHRAPGAEPHPLGRMAAERWLRSVVVGDPALAGARSLLPVEPTIARDSVKDIAPAVAVGTSTGGESIVVVCSTGIDLDLVPAAADARLAHAPQADLVLVVPARDAHPVTTRLASGLVRPARVVTVEGDWRG